MLFSVYLSYVSRFLVIIVWHSVSAMKLSDFAEIKDDINLGNLKEISVRFNEL